MKLRTSLLGETVTHVRPLNEAKAIENGSNFISEFFLFSVALALILAETYRNKRKDTNRRNDVDEKISYLNEEILELRKRLAEESEDLKFQLEQEKLRSEELGRILDSVLNLALRMGGLGPYNDLRVSQNSFPSVILPVDGQESNATNDER
jgi:optic atrophy 3 protein